MTIHITAEQTDWIFRNSDPLGEPEWQRAGIPIDYAPLDYRRAAFYDFTGEEFADAALSLIDFLQECDGPIPNADSVGHDLFTYGEIEFGFEAYRLLRTLNGIYETEAETETHFKTFDRLATPDDTPLIDVMHVAEQSGWRPPRKVLKALNWLRGEASRAFHLEKSRNRLAEENRAEIAELIRQGFKLGPNGYEKSESTMSAEIVHLPTSLNAFEIIDAASLAGTEPSPRRWLVRDLVPERTVSLLGGDGGTGKSLLALQLAVATVACKPWLGRIPDQGPAIYLSAEDDAPELHRRLVDIARETGTPLESLAGLKLISLAGRDAILAATDGRSSMLASTELFTALAAAIGSTRPKLLVLDTLSDLFGGNENDRTQARQFVSLLRGLAMAHDCAVLLLAHPSVQGMNSGSGLSGSTAWSNSVRSRLYLDRVRDESGFEPDPDARILRTLKANYGRAGEEIALRWHGGAFVTKGGGIFEAVGAHAKADRVFLNLLQIYEADGRPVSAARSANYAPALFSKDPRAEGVRKNALTDAMNRLFAAGKIKIEEFGPASRRRSKLVLVNLPTAFQLPSNCLPTG